jgi:hypothetical protein
MSSRHDIAEKFAELALKQQSLTRLLRNLLELLLYIWRFTTS